MSWPTKNINSWKEFRDAAENIMSLQPPSELSAMFAFRGQSNVEWSLEPSIARILKGKSPDEVRHLEQLARDKFVASAKPLLQVQGDSADEPNWWVWMQHFGAATRLLDWTKSPYVAAYFAVQESWTTDGVIWFFPVSDLHENLDIPDFLKQLSPSSPFPDDPFVMVISAKVQPDRQTAQQGIFTLCANPLQDHAKAIEKQLPEKCQFWGKLIIRAELKKEFLLKLRTMNVTAEALFPGLDGIGRSANEGFRLSSL